MVVWFLHSSHWLNQLSQCEKKSGLEVPNHDLNDPNRWGFSVDVTMLGLGVADCVRRINQRPGMGTFSAVRSCWLLWIQALSGGQAQGTTRRKNLISFSFRNLLIQDLDLVAWFSYFVWRGFLSVTFITSVRLHPQEMTQFNTIQTRGSTRPHERETLDSFDMVWAQDDQNVSWSAPRTSQPVDAHHEFAATLNSTRRPSLVYQQEPELSRNGMI